MTVSNTFSCYFWVTIIRYWTKIRGDSRFYTIREIPNVNTMEKITGWSILGYKRSLEELKRSCKMPHVSDGNWVNSNWDSVPGETIHSSIRPRYLRLGCSYSYTSIVRTIYLSRMMKYEVWIQYLTTLWYGHCSCKLFRYPSWIFVTLRSISFTHTCWNTNRNTLNRIFNI